MSKPNITFIKFINACNRFADTTINLDFLLRKRLPRKLKKQYKKRFGDKWVDFIK